MARNKSEKTPALDPEDAPFAGIIAANARGLVSDEIIAPSDVRSGRRKWGSREGNIYYRAHMSNSLRWAWDTAARAKKNGHLIADHMEFLLGTQSK